MDTKDTKTRKNIILFFVILIAWILLVVVGSTFLFGAKNASYPESKIQTLEAGDMNFMSKNANIGTETESIAPKGRREGRNVSIDSETKNFNDVKGKILENVEKNRGFVYESSTFNSGNKTLYLNVKIPRENEKSFLLALEKLEELHILSENQSSKDLEDEFKDTDLRLSSLKKRLEKLQELQKENTDVETVIDLEDRINNTIIEIESLEGNKKGLTEQVEYTVISISLKEVGGEKNKNIEPGFGEELKDTLKDVGRFYKTIGKGILFACVYILPIGIIGGIIYFVVRKKKKKKEAEK